ncbi:MAG: glycoside hydrolase family 15 protein, partial [Betaproteobacteria bacterium]|nr:glycoside hydrolase family 15 protein [Betaproteobacteria bacterium]
TPVGGDAETGVFAIDLQGFTGTERQYVRNTAVLQTIVRSAHGDALRITDFCPRFRGRNRMFRPMSFVRLVEPIAGRPVIRTRLRPAADYGDGEPQRHVGTHNICFHTPSLRYRVTTNASLTALQDGDWTVLDGPLAFVIGPDETLEDAPLAIARRFLDATVEYWQDWVRGLAIPAEWQEPVIRAAITLKLCTYEDTGAVLAALTTSIPEHAGSQRNWDYRFCWLRDSYFVVLALNRLGATRTMEAYLRYIDHVSIRTAGGPLQPLYGIGGEVHLTERIAPNLPGYRGMGPVRVGNLAFNQRQHDVYGAVVLAATQSFVDQRLSAPGDIGSFERLEPLGVRAAELYAQPDAGPWEFRGMERVHTFSAAMSWAGCDRLGRIAATLGLQARAEHWRSTAAGMRDSILQAAWNERRRSFTGSFGGDEIDATSLLLPELGIVRGDDPRFLQTLATVERELKQGDWLFRYRHADDFGTPVTAFTICAFWYLNALALAGRGAEARDLFQRLLERRTPLGLLSEDIDPATGELWGNFPQTYSMVGIINSAVRLSRSWEDVL